MMTGRLLCVVAALTLSVTACDETDVGFDPGEAEFRSCAPPWVVQESPPTRLDDGTVVPGAKGKLKRRDDKLRFKVKTTVTPGYSYTLWVCGFNEPSGCQGPGDWTPSCSLDDLLSERGDSFCQWGDGGVAPADGLVKFKSDSTELGELVLGTGPSDFMNSEIVLVVREHGPVIIDKVAEMTMTHDGGCEVNTCIDRQIASFGVP